MKEAGELDLQARTSARWLLGCQPKLIRQSTGLCGWEGKYTVDVKAVVNCKSTSSAYGFMIVQADVIARGYSGYNTRWAAYILEKIFTKEHPPPDLVTIFFGANDAALPDRLG